MLAVSDNVGLTRQSETSVAAGPPRANETILLVEDADPLREMIQEILEAAGYTVLASADPEEALRQLGATEVPVHLLLTDVVMPRMSGTELARNVRIARTRIRVLFMSGYTDEALGLQGVLDAGTQFIQKPFTTDALLGKVREALDEPYDG
jgi:two-component system, cell cycle sensor histidine kinase and response regulator CckA